MKPITALLVNQPKAGGLWLSYMLAEYFNAHHELDREIDLRSMRMIVSARPLEPWAPDYGFLARGDMPYLCMSTAAPSTLRVETAPALLLLRHPFDAVIVRYSHIAAERPDMPDIYRFAGYDADGLANTRGFLNEWAPRFCHQPERIVTYDKLVSDPHQTLARVLKLVDIEIDAECLDLAVERGVAARNAAPPTGNPYRPDLSGWTPRDPDMILDTDGNAASHEAFLKPEQLEVLRDILFDGLVSDAARILEEQGIAPQADV